MLNCLFTIIIIILHIAASARGWKKKRQRKVYHSRCEIWLFRV